jgi:hypothetical protein
MAGRTQHVNNVTKGFTLLMEGIESLHLLVRIMAVCKLHLGKKQKIIVVIIIVF